jgi:glycosyltransferase involved in cell wall biosynthesis
LPFKLLGVKYIFDHHDANPELYVSKYASTAGLYNILLALEKLSYRFSDVVMATNESYRNLAITRGRIRPENVFVVRNGPDLKTFNPVPPNSARKRGKRYLVGYVGSMNFQDGLDILLEVAKRVKYLGRNDIHFTCVGGGPELHELKLSVQKMNLEDTVEFTGRVPEEDLIETLSTADVCVNPDRPSEMNDISTMIKIMEYMALGKPIVQFESREGKFSAQGASLYADKEQGVVDFADRIIWLLDRPEERRKMGEFGRKRIEEQLAWKYSVPSLRGAYEQALRPL